jgi:hypothetical protein
MLVTASRLHKTLLKNRRAAPIVFQVLMHLSPTLNIRPELISILSIIFSPGRMGRDSVVKRKQITSAGQGTINKHAFVSFFRCGRARVRPIVSAQVKWVSMRGSTPESGKAE